MKAPNDIIDYIIIHELCHLKIQGHSYQFWSFLKQFVPDYQKKIDWLNRNSESLITEYFKKDLIFSTLIW
jgi:predicted metal-dependent hydrolase